MGEKKDKKDKKDMTEEEKAAKKAKKEAKRAAEAAPAAPAEVDEKAAKKAKKEAKKRAAEEAAQEPPAKKAKEDMTKEEKKAAKAAKKAAKEGGAEPAAPVKAEAAAGGEEVRVFVANLPFSMTDDWIKEELGPASAVEWLTHSDTGRFKGSGFLTFTDKAAADAAIALNGKDIEGRPVKVELATPKKSGPPGGFAGSGDVGEPSESIFCGNLSWSITEEALKETFSACGEIARIKWLEKDGEFKGIAFIDFNTVEAATKATKLAGTEVMGRPLRINFSKKKENAGGDKWGSGGGDKWGAGGGKTGRVERPYKPAGPKPDGCTELFCGNLPWSIDEAKITEFFKAAGATVSGCRWLNDKESGEFKGIGFVAFEDTSDVDKAVTLGGEQLDGRPIRIDFAGQKKEKPAGAWQGGW